MLFRSGDESDFRSGTAWDVLASPHTGAQSCCLHSPPALPRPRPAKEAVASPQYRYQWARGPRQSSESNGAVRLPAGAPQQDRQC